ncbi:MAG: tetratricopeptide repeat-containing sensor histidine kinase [Kordia sp.]
MSSNTEELKNYNHFLRGSSFKSKGVFEQAEQEFLKVTSDFEFMNLVKMMLGEVMFNQEKFQAAINYFKMVDSLSDDKLIGLKRSNIEENIGTCYIHLEQYDKAEEYFLKSIKNVETQNDIVELVSSYGNIASFYYNLYRDDEALPYFNKAYQLSKLVSDFQAKQDASFNMAIVEKNRKDFQKSIKYLEEHIRWKDSLNNQNSIWAAAEQAKEFAVREEQIKVSLLEAENKAKVAERNLYLYLAIILVLIVAALAYFYKEKIKSNKIITAQKESLDELNAMKDKLFSVVSHDLRSSVYALKTSNTELSESLEAKNLNALDDLLNTNSSIVNGAYNLLDNLLHWALLQTEQSYFEMEQMHLFFIVEQTAYNYKPLLLDKKIQFENNVPEDELIVADQESLKIVLRNLLDNAIKFSNPNGKITIYTKNTTENYCDLVIEDTGLGMSEATRLQLLEDSVALAKKENKHIIGTGLGMQLCKSMIQKNKGKFAIESELGKGTKMIVSLRKNLPHGSN